MKSPAKRRVGRFSTGNEKRSGAPALLRVGSFADGYAATRRSREMARPSHAGAMADKPLARYAAHLRTIATTLEEETSDGVSAEVAALSLAYVELALRDLSQAIDHTGDLLIPVGDVEKTPRERQAQLLASLRESSAALRAAAECCHRARNIVGTPAA